MSLQVVDVRKLREKAEHEARLTRAVEGREIAQQAEAEKASANPFAGLLKAGKPPVQDKPPYVYTEYLSGVSRLLAKAADRHCGAGGAVEKEVLASKDIGHGVTSMLGGGTYSDILGAAGALATIVSTHRALGPTPTDSDRAAQRPTPDRCSGTSASCEG